MKKLTLFPLIIGLLLLTPICLNAADEVRDAVMTETEQSDGAGDTARVEEEQIDGAEDAAMKAQNPLADIISMPLQWNTDFDIGSDDETGSTLNIQPIYPVNLDKGWTLINRAIVPLPKSVPAGGPSSDRVTGLGDITMMNWFSPEPKGAFMWGVGPVTVWPTATDERLGTDKFSVGPSVVLVYSKPGKFVAASVINAWWDVGGSGDKDVGVFYWQPIFNWFLPNKWYLTTAPVITKDLEGESGQKWIVPVGGGVGKMFNWGKLPMDITAQYYNYVKKPDAGPEWAFRLQLKLIFPK